jgi:hypothetical protein
MDPVHVLTEKGCDDNDVSPCMELRVDYGHIHEGCCRHLHDAQLTAGSTPGWKLSLQARRLAFRLPGAWKDETRALGHSFSPSRLFLIRVAAAAFKAHPNQAAKVRFQVSVIIA